MKGMKGKLLKKLKAIQPIAYNLKPERILMVNAVDGLFETFTKSPPNKDVKESQFVPKELEEEEKIGTFVEPDVIDVAELMKDLEEEDDEMEVEFDDGDDKENVGLALKRKDSVSCKENVEVLKKSENGFCRETRALSEIDVNSFRRPDMNSGSLFDPNLLAAFEEAVNVHITMSHEERKARIEKENIDKMREEEERKSRIEQENLELEQIEEEPPHKSRRIDEEEEEDDANPLLAFEEKCPPGGDESVILYTTTLRGIRKTFEDCNNIRFLLETFRIKHYERDVSMHAEFREELWRIFDHKALPPRLFIRGRYIGGAAEVLVLHEQGKLRPLFEGIPIDQSSGPCEGCAGVRFVPCFKCSGSHKIVDDAGMSTECQDCNENGLIICPLCC
ncbi:myb-like protein X [Mangifera indica]|uniref:myb-like protein X n=1 Tax=Mangifera indica TaxID=29780 RepID=UPI001CF98C4C|nr:myb-like protein X [Mangifera indica]